MTATPDSQYTDPSECTDPKSCKTCPPRPKAALEELEALIRLTRQRLAECEVALADQRAILARREAKQAELQAQLDTLELIALARR